jgi:hypothetical protein
VILKKENTTICLGLNKDNNKTSILKISILMNFLERCFKDKELMNYLDKHLGLKEDKEMGEGEM